MATTTRVCVWLLAPVYFDSEAFLILRERVAAVARQHLTLRRARLRFVVVDDSGGLDPDIGSLRALPDVLLVQPPFNLGHQRAIVYGIRSITSKVADADLVVTLDGDGEDRPEDLPRLLSPLLTAPDDRHRVVLAWRTRRRETPTFMALYLCFKALFRILTGLTVRTGNYAAFRGWMARRMLMHPSFDLCYSSSLVSLMVPITFVPCERGTRYAGRSRMNLQKLFMHGLRMLMPFTDRIAIRALVAFSLVFAGGIVLSLTVMTVRLFSHAAIPGWATSTLLLILILSFNAVGNFVMLFAVFSQSRGISLASLEDHGQPQPRSASSSAD